jgi:NADH dehydrogenase
MGGLPGGNLWVEGLFARAMYFTCTSCTNSRFMAGGAPRSGTASRLLTRRTEPRVKLH